MRRLTVALVLSGLALAAGACKRSGRHGPSELLSVVSVDDPRADSQLVQGFYPLEGNKWRWTAGHFSAVLRPPIGSAQDGARLELRLHFPDVVAQQLGAVTLSAKTVQGPLEPQQYTKAGDYVYARDVPPSVLGGDIVSIDFSVDKAMPPGKLEKRELGLIVTSVGLVAKFSK